MRALSQIQFLRTKLILLGAMLCALLLFAVSAKAGPGSTTPWSVPFDWSGFYIGGNLGGIFGFYNTHGPLSDDEFFADVDIEQQFNQIFPDGFSEQFVTFFASKHQSGFDGAVTGGGQTGFMFQFGHFVAGVEADVNRTALNHSFTWTGSTVGEGIFLDGSDGTGDGEGGGETDIIAETEFASETRIETNWTASGRIRLGYAQGAMLFYATAGGAWTDVNVRINDVAKTNFFEEVVERPGTIARIAAPAAPAPTPPPPNLNSEFIGSQTNTLLAKDDDVRAGWTAGAGIDVAVSDNVLIGLEYRHYDFGEETYHFSGHSGPIFPGSTRVEFDSDQVTLRFNVLFSGLFGLH